MTLDEAILVVKSLERKNTGVRNLYINVAIAKVCEAAKHSKVINEKYSQAA